MSVLKNIFFGLNFFILFSTQQINSYIYKFREFDGDNKIFCWGDIHFGCCQDILHPTYNLKKLQEIHKNQAKSLVNHIQTDMPKDTCVIIEDLYDIENTNYKKEFKKLSESDRKKGYSCCLESITQLCKKNNIYFENIECRDFWTLFADINLLKAKSFLDKLNELINEINQFNDNAKLNKFYSNKISKLKNNNSKFLSILKQNGNKYSDELKNKISDKELENFMNDFFELIDVKILHSIFENKDKQYIHICVGDDHISGIEKMLKELGYNKIQQITKMNKNVEDPLEIENYEKMISSENTSNINNNVLMIYILIILIITLVIPRRKIFCRRLLLKF